jgi:hypothetical protein
MNANVHPDIVGWALASRTHFIITVFEQALFALVSDGVVPGFLRHPCLFIAMLSLANMI